MNIINFGNSLNINKTYLAVSVLGNSLKLNIKYTNALTIELNKTDTSVYLYLPKKYRNMDNMEIINLSIQKLYSKIAETEIEYAMEIARHILKFAPCDYSIKRLQKDFYKVCKNTIIVNPDLVKYNREIINTTILQAFCKLKYKPNSKAYNNLLSEALNKYEFVKYKNLYLFKTSKIS